MFNEALMPSEGDLRYIDGDIFPAHYALSGAQKKRDTPRHKRLSASEAKRVHEGQILDSTLNVRELDALKRGLRPEDEYLRALSAKADLLISEMEYLSHEATFNIAESEIARRKSTSTSEAIASQSEVGISTIMTLSIIFIGCTLVAIFLRTQGANPITYILPLGLSGMFLIIGMFLEGSVFRARADQ